MQNFFSFLLSLIVINSTCYAKSQSIERAPTQVSNQDTAAAKQFVLKFMKQQNYITSLVVETEKNYAIQCPVDENWIYILTPGPNLPMGLRFIVDLNCTSSGKVSYILELSGMIGKSATLYLTQYLLAPSGL
jgi:hypothetical protein